MSQNHVDKLSDIYFSDPKLIWQHTISGEKNFDSCDFLGALKDLSSVPDWKEAFKGAENINGFLNRFDSFLKRNGDLSSNDQGQQSLYFSPSEGNLSPEKLLKLTQLHLKECAKLASLDKYNEDAEEWVEKLPNLPIEWIENGSRKDIDHYTSPASYLYEIFSDIYIDNKKNWSHFLYCLSEGCYGLAADYALQRYLMQDFYDLDINLSYQYELEWIHGACFHFSEEKCFVMKPKSN